MGGKKLVHPLVHYLRILGIEYVYHGIHNLKIMPELILIKYILSPLTCTSIMRSSEAASFINIWLFKFKIQSSMNSSHVFGWNKQKSI